MKMTKQIMLLLMIMLTPIVNASDQLGEIRYIQGQWSVTTTFLEDGKWGKENKPTVATAKATIDNQFIRMNMPVPFPGAMFQFEVTISFDRFNNIYRLALMDDVNGYMDIYSGKMKDGILIADNTQTGSAFPDGKGGYSYGKIEIESMTTGFQIRGFTSSNITGPFANYMKLDFVPLADK